MPSPEMNLINNKKLNGLARPVQVIAVTGGKGGVGKTSVSVNLATGSRRRRQARGARSTATWGSPTSTCCSVSPRATRSRTCCPASARSTRFWSTTPQGFHIVPAASGAADLASMRCRSAPGPGAGLQHARHAARHFDHRHSRRHRARRAAVLTSGSTCAGRGER